jgi:schlafen family protein
VTDTLSLGPDGKSLRSTPPASLARAWFQASLGEFPKLDPNVVVGLLTRNSDVDVLPSQIEAWVYEISFLKERLPDLPGSIFLEFNIPRMGRRIDAVVLAGSVVFVVEFKVGETHFERSALDQVWDYALDLKNFHEASHSVAIVPMLVATGAAEAPAVDIQLSSDGVARPLQVTADTFHAAIQQSLRAIVAAPLDHAVWSQAPYRPTPTIIEAARVLYAQHSVEAIARHDAGAVNLRVTSARLEELIDEARVAGRKIICFVTGVPGAGKTLVGLNIATQRRDDTKPTHAVFLSGNGPLVAVLREALTRDELAKRKVSGLKGRKEGVANPVKAFIQNVHHFRDEALRDPRPPNDHVVIFDEAQRAWNAHKTSSFMKRRKNQPDFKHSEPAFLLSYMDRHTDWAVVICLVGGGQEIHTGEAGIGEWIGALNRSFLTWHAYISPHLQESEYAVSAIASFCHRQNVHLDDSLHLAVSMRSFRAENVSGFVKALLDCESSQARQMLAGLRRFPIALTRDLSRARDWIRGHARGSERYGLVASSKALRLKPHAIDVRVAVDPVHWFLDGREDVRSSYYLEDCATEFQIQGLELDWTCVTWDGDLRFDRSRWTFYDFRGKRWQSIRNLDNQNYLRNAYRVLLTRARQGTVVFIPLGDPNDPTRLPEFYDETFNYLASIGIPVLA